MAYIHNKTPSATAERTKVNGSDTQPTKTKKSKPGLIRNGESQNKDPSTMAARKMIDVEPKTLRNGGKIQGTDLRNGGKFK